MRPQAKPFSVEIKKSRKSPQDEPGASRFNWAEAEAARPVQSTRSLEAERSFQQAVRRPPPAAAAPARVLPDLTAPPPEPVQAEEPAKRGRPRVDRSPAPRKPKVPKPKPVKVNLVKAPAARVAPAAKPLPPRVAVAGRPVAPVAATPAAQKVVVRRRAKAETLRRGQRWKRRLPSILR